MAIKSRKIRRPKAAKAKLNQLPAAPQLSLFDARCHVHLNATPRPIQDAEDSAVMVLAGMRFEVDVSSTINPAKQTQVGLEVLVAIHKVPLSQRISRDASRRLNVDGVNCTVTCRAMAMFESGVIEIRGCDDGLRISLPHPKKWGAGGIAWVRDRPICCDHERVNPTPWIPAKTCNCLSTKAGL